MIICASQYKRNICVKALFSSLWGSLWSKHQYCKASTIIANCFKIIWIYATPRIIVHHISELSTRHILTRYSQWHHASLHNVNMKWSRDIFTSLCNHRIHCMKIIDHNLSEKPYVMLLSKLLMTTCIIIYWRWTRWCIIIMPWRPWPLAYRYYVRSFVYHVYTKNWLQGLGIHGKVWPRKGRSLETHSSLNWGHVHDKAQFCQCRLSTHCMNCMYHINYMHAFIAFIASFEDQ
jgi:hypothetical protein